MKYVLFIITLLSVISAQAEESVTLPLTEYNKLYRDNIERAITDQAIAEQASIEESEEETVETLITIEKAEYQLQVAEKLANGRISLSGSLIQGKPEPIALFDANIAVSNLETIKGGRLISHLGKYCFISDGSKQFSMQIQVSLAVEEDARSRFVSFAIPQALQNNLQLDLQKDEKLLTAPGFRTTQGHYNFSPRENLELRFKKAQSKKTTQAPVVDTFTRISHRDKHLVLTSFFTPLRNINQAINIRTPLGARYLDSSLKPSWMKLTHAKSNKEESIQLKLPSDQAQPFYVRYELPLNEKTDTYSFTLANITGNKGREGEFVLEQPVDRELSLKGKNITNNLSLERLPNALRQHAEVTVPYAHYSGEGKINIEIKKYQAVPVPEIVLESLQFLAIFDESGSVMSSLRIQVPEQTNDRLQIKRIPGAEIWSVTVNGKQQSMFSLDEGMWIVPIQSGQKSLVEVKFLQAGKPVGIQGRLQAQVPDTGLTAHNIQVAIALPKRVELISLDADLEPADNASWIDETDDTGHAYYFKRAFYKGQSLELAVYYKEPVAQLMETRQ